MKKLFLIMALGVLSLTGSAQVEKIVLTPAKTGNEYVKETIDSITKVLPVPISQTLSSLALSPEGRSWNVYFTPASDGFNATSYFVYLRGKNGRQTLVYDRDGNLLQVKQVLKNAGVPESVKKTLDTKFSGWTMLANEERHVSANDKASTDYKVILKKGILKKSVLLDPEGDVKMALPLV